MSDVQVQTIRMVIDVEVRARAPRNPSLPAPDTDAKSHGYEQALFVLLEADPDLYAEFVKVQAISSLEALGIHNMISELAQIHHTHGEYAGTQAAAPAVSAPGAGLSGPSH